MTEQAYCFIQAPYTIWYLGIAKLACVLAQIVSVCAGNTSPVDGTYTAQLRAFYALICVIVQHESIKTCIAFIINTIYTGKLRAWIRKLTNATSLIKLKPNLTARTLSLIDTLRTLLLTAINSTHTRCAIVRRIWTLKTVLY